MVLDLYSFDIDSDLGNVIINNKKYHNFKSLKDGSDFKGSFRLYEDVGSINMNFKD
jgi:hypothetical protein